MEKKYYGRVSKQLSAIIENEDGLRLQVVAVDTAGNGVSILCNIYQREAITPEGRIIRNGKPVELSIALDLPDEDGRTSSIVARCHVAYSRRISNEQCMIGMRYVDFEHSNHERLLRFISETRVHNDGLRTLVCA